MAKQPGHLTRPWSMCRRWSGRQEKTSGQPIEPRAARHLPCQHLQPVDLPFDGALTPGQGYRRMDGGHVRSAPAGKTLEGREGARNGARQAPPAQAVAQ